MNRTSRAAAEAVLQAFERKGGVKYLLTLEDKEFVSLLKHILPKEIRSELGDSWESVIRRLQRGVEDGRGEVGSRFREQK